MSDVETTEEKRERPIVIRNTTDLQRLKVEKLMKYPDKPVIIPERPKERGIPAVPDFVRNVMGSSAGAGSGEFHVYRHLRRKEYARQKYMKEKGERERMEQDYHDKIEENKKKAEQKTAKKRAKRLKRKQKDKGKIKKVKLNEVKSESSDEESDEVEQESTEHNEKSQTESANSHIGEEKCRSEDKMENYDVDLQKTDDISRNTEAKLKSESLEEKDDDEVVQKVKNDENERAECVSSIERENGNGSKEQNCGENEKTNDISKSAEAKLDSESNVIKEHKLDKKTQNDEKDDEKVQDDTLQ